jgi:hypothetical protein
MPRKRTPSPEQQLEDRKMASYVQLACQVLVSRNPQSLELKAAERFLGEFANSSISKPKARKPKAQPITEHPAVAHHSV